MRNSIKLINAALDEDSDGRIVLRGVVDPDSYDLLLVDDYQREVLPTRGGKKDLLKALRSGSQFPDIELGVRGGGYSERDSAFYISDPTYIIDGLQRISSAKRYMAEKPEVTPRIGATVYFNTSKDWERKRFQILNAERVKLSANVLLRNMREEYEAIEMLHRMTNEEKGFVMKGRVCWDQRMSRGQGHIMTAVVFLKTIGYLHSHLGSGRSPRISELVPGVDKIMAKIGRNIFRENVRTFFDVIDQAFGIRTVTYSDGAIHLRHAFLQALADVFSDYLDFWRDNRLFVSQDLIRKLKLFPLNDPQVANLSGGTGKAAEMLYFLLVRHINSGKRTRKLTHRDPAQQITDSGHHQGKETENGNGDNDPDSSVNA
jgi:hypothetical protein